MQQDNAPKGPDLTGGVELAQFADGNWPAPADA